MESTNSKKWKAVTNAVSKGRVEFIQGFFQVLDRIAPHFIDIKGASFIFSYTLIIIPFSHMFMPG